MEGSDSNEVNGAISIIDTVIGLTITIETQKGHGCFVDQLFFDNNHLEINLKSIFLMLTELKRTSQTFTEVRQPEKLFFSNLVY